MFSLARDGLLGIKSQDCKSRPLDPQRERHHTLTRDFRWIKSLVCERASVDGHQDQRAAHGIAVA
jgi:hypothetical protein